MSLMRRVRAFLIVSSRAHEHGLTWQPHCSKWHGSVRAASLHELYMVVSKRALQQDLKWSAFQIACDGF